MSGAVKDGTLASEPGVDTDAKEIRISRQRFSLTLSPLPYAGSESELPCRCGCS